MSNEHEIDSLDMPAINGQETIEVGIEISQQLARWILENKRCAILDIETSQVYTVSLSPSVLERLRGG